MQISNYKYSIFAKLKHNSNIQFENKFRFAAIVLVKIRSLNEIEEKIILVYIINLKTKTNIRLK